MREPTPPPPLPHRDRLLANTALNLAGLLVPILLAFLTLPYLLRTLGPDRFGVLSLIWAALSYFLLFDFGVGRALTWITARRLGERAAERIGAVAWSSLVLTLLCGVLAGALLFALAPWFCSRVLRLPATILDQSTLAFRILALAVPSMVTFSGLRGLLEAHQRFDLVGGVRALMALATFGIPAIVATFTTNLAVIAAILVVGRWIGWLVAFACCWKMIPSMRRRPSADGQALRELIRFGGWMTISNLVSPVMTYFDRFALAALVSVEMAGYATTAFEAVSRIVILPVALVGVLFPVFSETSSTRPIVQQELYRLSTKALFVVLLPVTLILLGGGEVGLRWWAGDAVANAASLPLQILSIGVLANGIAHVPFALVQGQGRSDLTAALHLLEAPLYVVAAWWLVSAYGIVGAALAWSLRALLDSAALFVLAKIVSRGPNPRPATLGVGATAFLLLIAVAVSPPGAFRILLLATTIGGFFVLSWRYLLREGERSWVASTIRRLGTPT